MTDVDRELYREGLNDAILLCSQVDASNRKVNNYNFEERLEEIFQVSDEGNPTRRSLLWQPSRYSGSSDIMQKIEYREMTIADYSAVIDLMNATPGVTVRDADSREATGFYFQRNPHLSFIAEKNGELIGCVMCGHDGRRGYLQHLIVKATERKKGIGSQLVTRSFQELKSLGIHKTHIHVIKDHDLANNYWKSQKWIKRDDIHVYSLNQSNNPNA